MLVGNYVIQNSSYIDVTKLNCATNSSWYIYFNKSKALAKTLSKVNQLWIGLCVYIFSGAFETDENGQCTLIMCTSCRKILWNQNRKCIVSHCQLRGISKLWAFWWHRLVLMEVKVWILYHPGRSKQTYVDQQERITHIITVKKYRDPTELQFTCLNIGKFLGNNTYLNSQFLLQYHHCRLLHLFKLFQSYCWFRSIWYRAMY